MCWTSPDDVLDVTKDLPVGRNTEETYHQSIEP